MINWLAIKTAANYYTYGGNTKLFQIRPNLKEVAYLSKHPDYHDEHLERVMDKLRELKIRRLQQGVIHSMAGNPYEQNFADKRELMAEVNPEKEAKRQADIDEYMAKWDANDREKVKAGYNKYLLKALKKFDKKFGPNSKKPYSGEGLKINDVHTNIIYQ